LRLALKTFQLLNSNHLLSTPFKIFAGISREEASSESFRAALSSSVAEVLDVPAESVTLAVELARRSLLSSVSLTYTASVTSGMASDVVLGKLNSAIAEGTYLALVKEKSGLPISSLTRLALAEVKPTAPPASEPTASPVALTGTVHHTPYSVFITVQKLYGFLYIYRFL
jgi:hypothetical protein